MFMVLLEICCVVSCSMLCFVHLKLFSHSSYRISDSTYNRGLQTHLNNYCIRCAITPPAHRCVEAGVWTNNCRMRPKSGQVGVLLGWIWIQIAPTWARPTLREYSPNGWPGQVGEDCLQHDLNHFKSCWEPSLPSWRRPLFAIRSPNWILKGARNRHKIILKWTQNLDRFMLGFWCKLDPIWGSLFG